MPRQLTPRTTLESLKREAKRWLRTLRENAGDAGREARTRLERAFPTAPAAPTLRDVQHALAREFGADGWTSLKTQLNATRTAATPTPSDAMSDERRVAWFLENACPDHHIRGAAAHVRARAAAMRILERYPDIAHDSIHTAAVCGDLAAVQAILAERPDSAVEKNAAAGPDRSGAGHEEDQFEDLGPKRWDPLLFLCFTRLPLDAANDNAVAIAEALLDAGADPNSSFMAGDSVYTPLVGVVGEGEENRPPHPRRDELARLLLERGAEPYDIQVLYNVHFHGDIVWLMELIHEFSIKRGRSADWYDPDWQMLGMGGYGPGAFYLLRVAIQNNNIELAHWLLAHGANPNRPVGYTHPKFHPKQSLYEQALHTGVLEIADLLVQYGATPTEGTPTPADQFMVACFRLDRESARAMVHQHPELLLEARPMIVAAERDRADVAELLLELGVSPDVATETNARGLHAAAYANSLHVAQLLVDRGAEIDPVNREWGSTPLGAAEYANNERMMALLGRYSTDVWELAYCGFVDRLREVLSVTPNKARVVTKSGHTPLMWLPPQDETRAMDVARLLMANGADPSVRNSDGQTAADRAERLGMFRVAELLRSPVGLPASSDHGSALTLRDYERRAEALLDAYRTGTREAMERHWSFTWHRRAWHTMRSYVQLDLGRAADADPAADITLDDARFLIAREHGFESWDALTGYAAEPAPSGIVTAKPIDIITTDANGGERSAGGSRAWDEVVEQIRAGGLPGLDARGQMTDAMLLEARGLDDVTILKLGGSSGVTDAGLRALERMPRLRHLDLSGCAITDRGLDVLRALPELETVSLAWTRTTDAGAAHLRDSARLRHVDLMGTATGDGAVAALAGKNDLRILKTGNGVTDGGVRLLNEFPAFRMWSGEEATFALLSYDGGPTHLTLRGSFTDAGLAALVGLDGLFALNLDSDRLAITPSGLAPLAGLANLGWLAIDAKDESMPYIASLPKLRFLGCQDTTAGDDGFVALSRSRTIEQIWGRRCHNLGTRGFKALSTMPALRGLSVSCLNVADDGIATLPEFPSLRELMPMDIPDAGYRHIAKCGKLESLILMYCRDTGDDATEHIAGMTTLKKYFASYTKITDRSLEILGLIDSLEEIELSAIAGVTNEGVAKLARLPRLRTLKISGLRLSRPKPGEFPPRVQVSFDL